MTGLPHRSGLPFVLARALSLCVLWTAPQAAGADEEGTTGSVERALDTLWVRPTVDPSALVALPASAPAEGWHLGAALQLEDRPVVYFEGGDPTGDLVVFRSSLALGVTRGGDRWGLDLDLPLVHQVAGEPAALAPASALAVADPALGATWVAFRSGGWDISPRARAWLPLGTGTDWVGESSLRPDLGLAAGVTAGPYRFQLYGGMTLRAMRKATVAPAGGPEWHLGAGLLRDLGPRWSALAESTLRAPLSPGSWGSGSRPAGVRGGLRYRPRRGGAVDAVVGGAVDAGYGAADFRFVARWTTPLVPEVGTSPPPPPPLEVAEAAPEPEPPPEPSPPSPAPVATPPIEHVRITLLPAFERGGTDWAEEAAPVLDAAARLLRDYPEIRLVVLEGHACPGEPSRLAHLRGERAFRALIGRGVLPERLGYRGVVTAGSTADAGDDVPEPDSTQAPGGGEASGDVADQGADADSPCRPEVALVVVRFETLPPDPVPPASPAAPPLPWSGDPQRLPPSRNLRLGHDPHPDLEITRAEPESVPDPLSPDAFRQALDDELDTGDPSDPALGTPPTEPP